MPRKIRARPSALLQHARSELGRAPEEDRRRAGAADRSGHAPVYRAGDEGWHINGKQKARKSKQPTGRRLQPHRANKPHHLLRREQLLRPVDEPAFAEERLPLEACGANGGTDNEERVSREKRLDLRGRSRVPRRAARPAQRLPAGARERRNRAEEDVRIPAAADGRTRP